MTKKIFYLIAAIIFTSCQSDTSNSSDTWNRNSSTSTDYYEEPAVELSEAELKRQLEDTECMSPNDYLDGEISSKPIYKNLLSTKVKGLKITLNIWNMATIATFKDLAIHLELTSKTGSVVKSEDFVVYEYVRANGSIKYKYEMDITNQQFKDYSSISWYIRNATCVK